MSSSSSSSLEHNSLSLKEKGEQESLLLLLYYLLPRWETWEGERAREADRQTGGDGGSPPEATDLSWDSEKEGRKDASIAVGSGRLVDNARVS